MSHTILLVEDNENNRNLLKDILDFHGYQVAMASDGQEALVLAQKLLPDLILMDIQMPNMDGLTACKILKSDPTTSDLKIVALTSFAMQGDPEKFLAAGFDAYISKPLNTRELPLLMKQWLSSRETS